MRTGEFVAGAALLVGGGILAFTGSPVIGVALIIIGAAAAIDGLSIRPMIR